MKDDLSLVEQSVWCHVFMARCATAENARQAERVADEALEVLRRRGLVFRADKVIAERVLLAGPDSISICVRDR